MACSRGTTLETRMREVTTSAASTGHRCRNGWADGIHGWLAAEDFWVGRSHSQKGILLAAGTSVRQALRRARAVLGE